MIPGSPVFTLPEGVALLDVREDDEWTAGHAPQAVHVPMGQVSQRVKEIAAAFPEPPVYVVCRSGMRSAQITAYLLGIGLDTVNVEGGMESWVAGGRNERAAASAVEESTKELLHRRSSQGQGWVDASSPSPGIRGIHEQDDCCLFV